MTGIVKLVNGEKKMVAVETGYGDYMVLRLINPADTMSDGDKLEGELTMMGEQSIFNITRKERVRISIEDTYLQAETAFELIK